MITEQQIKQIDKNTKIEYLLKSNLFKENVLREMDLYDLDNLFKIALEIKGFKIEVLK